MLDKCRAELAGMGGEYHFNCPNDQRLLSFLGIEADAFQREAATGKGDGEMLAWIRSVLPRPQTAWEILQWSEYMERRVPTDNAGRQMLNNVQTTTDATRGDIATYFDAMDLDDDFSFPKKDLTQRPPRSPRTRLGGFVILPRLLDKCRAQLSGTNGEYQYGAPLDERFFRFTNVPSDELYNLVATGLGDAEILSWIHSLPDSMHCAVTIEAWSRHRDTALPTDVENRQYMINRVSELGPHRDDIATWHDLLDLDDYVTFGGVS
jgi:hypothetical protein